ncbi:MAG: hypothetical protein ABQ298_08060, partial [Puniceicoccaceae bacterium]
MNTQKNIVTILASMFFISGALLASVEETPVPSASWESNSVSVSAEGEAVDFAELIRESLREDELCAPYADTLGIKLSDDLVKLTGVVDSENVRWRVEEIVRQNTHLDIDNQIEVAATEEE